jgi:hypothetical protein
MNQFTQMVSGSLSVCTLIGIVRRHYYTNRSRLKPLPLHRTALFFFFSNALGIVNGARPLLSPKSAPRNSEVPFLEVRVI